MGKLLMLAVGIAIGAGGAVLYAPKLRNTCCEIVADNIKDRIRDAIRSA